MVMKRRWEEMESMLEQLDFVASAEVRTTWSRVTGSIRSLTWLGAVLLSFMKPRC